MRNRLGHFRRVQPSANQSHGAPLVGNGRPADNSLSLLATGLIWTMIGSLVIRWDWMDNTGTTQYEQLAVGQAFGPSPIYRIIKITLLVLGTVLVLRRLAPAMRTFRLLNRMLIAFVILVPLSVMWSISPQDTLVRFVSIISVVQVCWAFVVTGWHPRRFQEVLRPLCTVLIVASIIAGILMPTWIIEVGEGTLKNAWHGLVESKNKFGEVAGICAIFWVHAWAFGKIRWWRAAPPLALAIGALFLSRSSTGLLSALFAVAFMLMLHQLPKSMRRYLPYIVGFFAVCVFTYGLAALQLLPGLDVIFAPVAAMTGKDTTFSARSIIWQIIEEHIGKSPILGSGYGAYWIGPLSTSPSSVFLSRMYFYPFEAHNGYLEVTNDLGYVGLSCLFGYLAIYIRDCVQLFKVDRVQATLFLGIFFHQALINLSESAWFTVTNPFSFIVMVLATFCLARARADMRHLLPAPVRRRRALGSINRSIQHYSPCVTTASLLLKKT